MSSSDKLLWSIDKLRNYSKNPRAIKKDKFEELKKRVQRYGQFKPLIITPDGEVLGGNMRLRAYNELGINDIWVSIVDPKTEAEKLEMALVDNEEMGYYEDQALAELIEEYKNDIDLTKYSVHLGKSQTLQEILAQFGPDEVVEDEAPEVPEVAESVLGEVYQLGRHRLMCGDSTKIEDVEKLMNGQKADMVFTDPPYGINVVSGTVGGSKPFGSDGTDNIVKANNYSPIIGDSTTQTARDVYSLLVSLNISTLSFWGGNYFTDFLPPSKGWLIWDKKGKEWEDNFSDCEMLWTNKNIPTKIIRYQFMGLIQEGEREKRVHPTQKPVGMIIKCFKYLEGVSVLDLFGGSGSTLIACEQTDRVAFLMELDPKYCDVIRKRYDNFTNDRQMTDNGKS